MAIKEIYVTAKLSLPVAAVREAWINSDQMGPIGFIRTVRKMETMPGGEWRTTLHVPAGKNYPNKNVFVEVDPSRKIVFRHVNPNYVATILFDPDQDENLLDWKKRLKLLNGLRPLLRC